MKLETALQPFFKNSLHRNCLYNESPMPTYNASHCADSGPVVPPDPQTSPRLMGVKFTSLAERKLLPSCFTELYSG